MTSARRTLAVLVVAAGLAACGGRIWTDQESAGGVREHWYTRETSIDAATREAKEHCRTWGRDAVLVDEFVDNDVTVASYACQ